MSEDGIDGAAAGRSAEADWMAAVSAATDWPTALTVWAAARLDRAGGISAARLLTAIDRDIAMIDRLIGPQIDAVLHHPRFQALEASWRGLAYLVDQVGGGDSVKVRVLSARWGEICRDLDRALEFDQSTLFDRIYSNEFGMPGGEPFGIVLADYAIQHRRTPDHPTDDVTALKGIAAVAAAAFTPFVLAARPALLGVDAFAELGLPLDLDGTFREPGYERWGSLRDMADSRFLAVVLPRVLMRRPYQADPAGHRGLVYREDVTRGEADMLWGNAVYAFGGVVVRAFLAYGWFADIRGAARDREEGGLVTGLTSDWFDTDRPGLALKYPLDVSISESLERVLSDAGFVPLMNCRDTEFAAFYSNQSLQRPAVYREAVATTNARLSAMIQYMLCIGRFAHYIKVIARDWVGGMSGAPACEDLLRGWLSRYVLSSDDASPEMMTRYPLREAAVSVRERPGQPGSYASTIHLRPHFQLDQMVSSFKLVTELPGPAA